MALSISMFVLASIGILISTLFDLNVKLGKVKIGLYWVIPLVIAVILLFAKGVDASAVWAQFTSKDAMNPLKILVLFLSMTGLSVYLDEIGFFRWLANATLKKQAQVRKIVFPALHRHFRSHRFHVKRRYHTHVHAIYLLFCENCEIDPVPYIVTEFVAANTWSMLFIIGNPTNIYLATTYGVGLRNISNDGNPNRLCRTLLVGDFVRTFCKETQRAAKTARTRRKIDDKPCLIIGLVGLLSAPLCLQSLRISALKCGW